MTEWHNRYGGPGVMIYWHAERRNVCIYSQLKSCSSSEVAAMIEGLLRHGTDAEIEASYFVAEGPHRDALLAQPEGSGASGSRVQIAGFRLLSYDGQTARVDIGMRVTTGGTSGAVSGVYGLIWQGGDWKLRIDDPKKAIDGAMVPDLTGYIGWGAG